MSINPEFVRHIQDGQCFWVRRLFLVFYWCQNSGTLPNALFEWIDDAMTVFGKTPRYRKICGRLYFGRPDKYCNRSSVIMYQAVGRDDGLQ